MKNSTKFVALKPYNHISFYNNGIFKDNNSPNSFFGIKKALSKFGIEINTIDFKTTKTPDVLLYVDMPYPWELSQWKKLIFSDRRKILLALESPLINPFNHMTFLHFPFQKIYTWNDNLIDKNKYSKIHIPQLDFDFNGSQSDFDKRKFLITVLSNKSVPFLLRILNPFKSSLYEKREEAFQYFESVLGDDFCLYGVGWNKPKKFSIKERIFGFYKYKSYKGKVRYQDKQKLLSEFKFCLAFENASAPGYVSEKMFDCFKANCIPIYYGAKNIEDYVPKDCFIDFRDFKSFKDLINFLKNMDEISFKNYLKNAERFMRDKHNIKTWSQKYFAQKLIKILE